MAIKKRKKDEGGGYYWMDTYGDFVTLLLTFFVLLYSTSSTDTAKWELLWQAIQTSAGKQVQVVVNNETTDVSSAGFEQPNTNGTNAEIVVGDNPDTIKDFDQLFAYLNNFIKKNGLEQSMSVEQSSDKLLVTFQNNVFFDGDKAIIRKDGRDLLDVLSRALAQVGSQVGQIVTWGHTARAQDKPNDPAFDDELSALRAAHVCTHMRVNLGDKVAQDKQSSAGFGEWHPVIPYDGSEATRAKNRRVEIVIAKEGSGIIDINKIYNEVSADPNGNSSHAAEVNGTAGTASGAAGAASAAQ